MNDVYMVVKRDGSEQPYDEDKVRKISRASGLNDEEAETLTTSVTKMVKSSSGTTTSLRIRAKVLEDLLNVNEYAAGLFEWYEKNK